MGVLGIEFSQVHPHKSHEEGDSPLKMCDCKIHSRMHLICSHDCYLKSQFHNKQVEPVVEWGKGISISNNGPIVCVQNYVVDAEEYEAMRKKKRAR